MGEKDKIEKLLEDYPDVFADIINVLVYQGEEAVSYTHLVIEELIHTLQINLK